MIDEVVTLHVIKLRVLANVAETYYGVIVWFFNVKRPYLSSIVSSFFVKYFCNPHVLYNSCLSILILLYENVILISLLQQLQRQSWTI